MNKVAQHDALNINPDLTADDWWYSVLFHADRFFALTRTYEKGMKSRVFKALLINLVDQRDTVEYAAYPPSISSTRSHLLDAMSATLMALTDSGSVDQSQIDGALHELNQLKVSLSALGIESVLP